MKNAFVKSLMIVPALCLASVLGLAPAVSADPVTPPADNKVQIKPLDKADIEAMAAQMPDFNALMAGLQSVIADPKVRAGLDKAANAAGNAMGDIDMDVKTQNGMPDMNAMAGAMLSLLGDEDLMQSLSGALSAAAGPLEQVMVEQVMQDAMPEAPAAPKPGENP